MSLRVLKWSVPVDDQDHAIGGGAVLLVACQQGPETVQVWTLDDGRGDRTVPVRVFATGQPLPGDVEEHLGSTVAGSLVWHVFRMHAHG